MPARRLLLLPLAGHPLAHLHALPGDLAFPVTSCATQAGAMSPTQGSVDLATGAALLWAVCHANSPACFTAGRCLQL